MRLPKTASLLILASLLTGSAAASATQGARLRGPVIGYVLDDKQAIRPVNGIPGSSLLGEPVGLPFPVAVAAFSPHEDSGLVVSASDDHSVCMVRNLGGIPQIEPIPDAIRHADRVVLNADASAGVLLDSDGHQLQVVRGLPSSPDAESPVDLSTIPGTITAIALDRAAANILIAASADHGALYLASAKETDAPPRLIASFGLPTALGLMRGDQDVIVADASVNEITLLRNFAGTPEAVLLASERDRISEPVGITVTNDNRKLYVANGQSRTLAIWDFETRAVERSFVLDAAPTQLRAFKSPSIFILNEAGEHPLLLLETAEDAAVYFVPAHKDQ